MRIKHIAFHGVEPALGSEWTASQRRWLELSIASGGLVDAWGASSAGKTAADARAVFTWESEDALQNFMEHTHDRALQDAGSIGRSAVLYLEDVEQLGPRADATYVGEAIAWIKDGGIEPWLESQRAWTSAMSRADGFVGGSVRRGRRTFVVTSFWRDANAHRRYLDEIVPRLRQDTGGDAHTARLIRFEAPLVPDLSFAR
jgi:heme-degrading monooxygenase HmoA